MIRKVTKENYLLIAKNLFKEQEKIVDALKRGYIYDDEVITEMFDIHFNVITKRHSYDPKKRNEILQYFQRKKFLIFNKIDMDKENKYNFFNTNINIDIIKLFNENMEHFDSNKLATIVVRTWYLKLQFGLDVDRYKVKKRYTFDELLLEVKNMIVDEGENENK